jgi:hypothetical protein
MYKALLIPLWIGYLLMAISLPAAAAEDVPAFNNFVYVPQVSVASAGGIRWLNCGYGQAGRVAWFVGTAGRLITIWRYTNAFGIPHEEARIFVATGRGQIFAQMPSKFGYSLHYVDWGYDGPAFVEYSFCGS